ncbi:BgTH12-01451 [Blumeria graminis f. sp. triticale]|uniref:Zinc transporter n=1 Tax=Blumeria graminis f. sp. triticale TaxID=1689686 RepID=A0A9W4D3C5_BLUGR|nr:BgTH12-01451 [Blumeria graminis f. sp. triticale]
MWIEIIEELSKTPLPAEGMALISASMSYTSHSHGHRSHSFVPPRSLSPSRPSKKGNSLKTGRQNTVCSHPQPDLDSSHGKFAECSTRNTESIRPSTPPNPIRGDGLSPSFLQESAVAGVTSINTLSAEKEQESEHQRRSMHDHKHHHKHDHKHDHHDNTEKRSKFTRMMMRMTERWPIIHAALTEKDSRRILYFMSLNFGFMLIQAFYGYLTDSLGLLSDSIHMFFDCLALGVGLFAAIASKWPPSQKFPFGFGKIESLSGFGNGVFLILISIEIMIEAVERIIDGHETQRLGELFAVSFLGLLVNLVGMACFGHHGHDHAGHCHKSASSPSNSHKNSHNHLSELEYTHESCSHNQGSHSQRMKSKSHSADFSSLKNLKQPRSIEDSIHDKSHIHSGSHMHSHSHDDDNMHGIFLHVLADTMGSGAVVLSTALTYLTGMKGWDPVASGIIAILIFLSSIPLIKSSAKKLLLTLPDDREYSVRNALTGINDVRGIMRYYNSRFWLGENTLDGDGEKVFGTMHIIATRGSDLEEVQKRTQDYLSTKGIDLVVQVEKEEASQSENGPIKLSDK